MPVVFETTGIWVIAGYGHVISVLQFMLRQPREDAIPNDDSYQGHYRIL